MIERVTSRFPSGPNLVRLEKWYVSRGDAAGVCKVLNIVGKLYNQESLVGAEKIASKLVNARICPLLFAQSDVMVRYPIVFGAVVDKG